MDERVSTDLSRIQAIQAQCPFSESLLDDPEKLSEKDQKVQLYFLLNSEEDAIAAMLLATPYLDERTLLYELGCWNGKNIINHLLYASTKGRLPKFCIGADINYRALTMGQSVTGLLSIESLVQFHMSNALYPFDPTCLQMKFDKEVRIALRLIPVLEPLCAKAFLKNLSFGFI